MTSIESTSHFDTTVLSSDVPVLVDFYADWCQPCKRIAPPLEALSAELADQAKVVKVNIESHPDLAERYAVRTLPSLLFFSKGNVVDQLYGAQNPAKVRQQLLKLIH